MMVQLMLIFLLSLFSLYETTMTFTLTVPCFQDPCLLPVLFSGYFVSSLLFKSISNNYLPYYPGGSYQSKGTSTPDFLTPKSPLKCMVFI
ncbi:hypothetical protein B0H16DRAFT_1618664 [Mycena metata]|uniref:ATP synthase F0 subunit 8 n=1 Tax=Mycena metata TaxID=1033252 RepID=A0AAD7MFG9_9AGAR|nr:hypothetical protein B0H16DRAFT_1618664 [Mycena metata]